ncbi:MAG: protein kinase domain-containing protein [Nannocystales bacterium]
MSAPRDIGASRISPATEAVSFFQEDLIARVVGGGIESTPEAPADYELIERLGEGGMGEVWRARSKHHGLVALKLLRRSLARVPSCQRRFLREARATQAISNPGVVVTYDVGTCQDGRPFIAMELVEGRTLRDVIDADGPLDWARACSIWTQVAAGLAAAHEQGIVHRDIKPSNIIVHQDDDGREHCTVIDFGLVRALGVDASTELTTTGQLIGTPSYISPEALRGVGPDTRSDQYSLGCVMYETLESTRPFNGSMLEELFLQHLTARPPVPRLPKVPEPLRVQAWAVLKKCLAKEPRDRFDSMASVVRALASVRPGARPVRSGHPPAWWRSKRAFVAIGVLCVAATLAAWAALQTRPTTASTQRAVLPAEHPSDGRAVEVVTGVAFSCARSEAGKVRCWGADSKGRLGRGTSGANIGDNEHPRSAPALDLPKGGVPTRIVSGPDARHACLLFDGGRLRCWGSNEHGELGHGTTDDWGDSAGETIRALPDLGLSVETVALGGGFSCATNPAGEARCWGKGDHGVRGDGSEVSVGDDEPIDTVRPVALGDASVLQLALGADHACARIQSGELDDSVRCWGSNAHGQLGVAGFPFAIGDGVGNGLGRGARPDDPALAVSGLEGLLIESIHAGGNRSCVVQTHGGVRCWGADALSVLGYQPEHVPWCTSSEACDLEAPPPFDLPLGSPTVSLALGQDHACAVDPVGDVRCWGTGTWGRLGDGSNVLGRDEARGAWSRPAEDRIVELGDFDRDGFRDPVTALSASNWHTCATMVSGGVRCWGRGITGRLGYRSSDNIGDNETPAAYYEATGYADIPVF